MNEIVNKFLLEVDSFMSEIHLKQPVLLDKSGFTDSAYGPFTKNKERCKNLYRQEIHIISTRMTLIKLVFNMIPSRLPTSRGRPL